ncbi:MAG: sodium-dependent transporter [Anaerococcus vaginalis]|nr:sodium-dependent transporter [Anaerococcus vaginalis]
MKEKNLKRDGFQSKWGFILACIGSAVGMGNIWRFPILVSKYDGMTFLIPYFIFVILIASTGVISEMALGRFTESGTVRAFGKCTELRYKNKKIGESLGVIPVLGSLALAIGYTCVMAWIFKYTFMAFSGELKAMGNDMDLIGETFSKTASSSNFWIFIAILASFLIVIFGVSKGIERSNKIMMPSLFILFVFLAIYISTMQGAADGYKYIFTINKKLIKNPQVWLYAFGQAFFSLSVAGSGTIIYGSYLSKKEDLVESAKNVGIFDTIASLMAAFVIIPAMATTKTPLNTGGPGLMFIYLVNVLNSMPAGRILGMIFYLCVLFAGISSIINLYESSVAYLQEKFDFSRKKATLIIHIIGLISAILIQNIVGEWMDVISIYVCPLGAGLAGIMFLWIGGKEFALKAVNQGAKKPVGNFYFLLSKYVYVGATIIALIAGAILGGIG